MLVVDRQGHRRGVDNQAKPRLALPQRLRAFGDGLLLVLVQRGVAQDQGHDARQHPEQVPDFVQTGPIRQAQGHQGTHPKLSDVQRENQGHIETQCRQGARHRGIGLLRPSRRDLELVGGPDQGRDLRPRCRAEPELGRLQAENAALRAICRRPTLSQQHAARAGQLADFIAQVLGQFPGMLGAAQEVADHIERHHGKGRVGGGER